jgi:uncharacterized membrane protein YphA (DoxX/SURF4 family)
VLAHVDYITDLEPSPDPIGFLLGTLAQPASLPLLLAGLVVVLGAIAVWARWRPFEAARLRFIERAGTYEEYLPWIARLSAGLLLLGAGLSRTLFVPRLDASGPFALLLTGCGFLLLLGLAVRPAAVVALVAYLGTLVLRPELLLMFDLSGALAVAALLGPGRPSLDDLLRAAFPRGPATAAATRNLVAGRNDDLIPLLVRLGLGGAFLASGFIDKLFSYERALEVVQRYRLTSVVPVTPELWVVGAALVESTLGVAVILGVLTRFTAIVAFAVLSLALFALPGDPVIAHVGLFGLSSVLVILGGGRWSIDRMLLTPLATRVRPA